MADTIFRQPTETERADYRQLGARDPEREFRAKLAEEQLKHDKAGKPFANKAALDKFRDVIRESVEKSKRKHGYVKFDEIKMPEIDLKPFSGIHNPKDFELIEETERSDEVVSKRNPGLDIRIKTQRYQYKDYGGIICIMEDPSSAIKRAQEKKEHKEVKTK